MSSTGPMAAKRLANTLMPPAPPPGPPIKTRMALDRDGKAAPRSQKLPRPHPTTASPTEGPSSSTSPALEAVA